MALNNAYHIDKNVVGDLLNLDSTGSLFTQLVNIFENESKLLISAMRTAVVDGQKTCLQAAAHRFRSTCYNLGARSSAIIAAQIETLAQTNRVDFDLISILVTHLEQEVTQSLKMLKSVELESFRQGKLRQIS